MCLLRVSPFRAARLLLDAGVALLVGTDEIARMATLQQGGAIVVRFDADRPRVLLVTARRNPRNWVFPKGHVERGETPEAAAVREAWEEAGVVARPIAPAGTIEFRRSGDLLRVHHFVLAWERDDGPGEEDRSRAWCSLDDALERLAFDHARRLLRHAWTLLPRPA